MGIRSKRTETQSFDALNREIVSCEKCQRLRDWCSLVALEKRKSFLGETYWGKPVPNFGDPDADGLIVGLAPAAHGANRTGQMFTGDRSGDWLFRSLHKHGLANLPHANSGSDGLSLNRIMITAVCHCAPPQNKPDRSEILNCSAFMDQTLALRPFKVYLCLGQLAWMHLHKTLGVKPLVSFSHGAISKDGSDVPILACYHPSQQNTFTGKLTEEMLDSVVAKFAKIVLA